MDVSLTISASGMDRGESWKRPEGLIYQKKEMNGHISSTRSLAPLLNSYQAINYCLRTHYPSLLRPLSNDGEKDSTHYIILISNLENSVT